MLATNSGSQQQFTQKMNQEQPNYNQKGLPIILPGTVTVTASGKNTNSANSANTINTKYRSMHKERIK